MTKVSVVIPTYKRPDTLDRAINSVLNQTLKELEVIVVDDNNPDSEGRALTEAKMSQFAGNPRVRYIKHEHNKNGSAARNTGARMSNGEYIAFLDDDDEFFPKKLESQLLVLEGRSEEWACCYSKYATQKVGKKPVEFKECREGNLFLEALMREFHIASGSNLLVKKTAFDAIDGFDESFIRNQDIEFLTRLLQRYKIAYSDYCGLLVHLHNNHGYFDEQQVINQYLERFHSFISALSKEDQELFYRKINQQRFFDYFRVKYDLIKCATMIHRGDISFVDAVSITTRRLITYLKR